MCVTIVLTRSVCSGLSNAPKRRQARDANATTHANGAFMGQRQNDHHYLGIIARDQGNLIRVLDTTPKKANLSRKLQVRRVTKDSNVPTDSIRFAFISGFR